MAVLFVNAFSHIFRTYYYYKKRRKETCEMKDITESNEYKNSENCHRGGKGGKGQGSGTGGKGGSKDVYHVESSSSDDLDGQAAMEMTGLMYKPPTSQAELDSYKEVYPFSPEQYAED